MKKVYWDRSVLLYPLSDKFTRPLHGISLIGPPERRKEREKRRNGEARGQRHSLKFGYLGQKGGKRVFTFSGRSSSRSDAAQAAAASVQTLQTGAAVLGGMVAAWASWRLWYPRWTGACAHCHPQPPGYTTIYGKGNGWHTNTCDMGRKLRILVHQEGENGGANRAPQAWWGKEEWGPQSSCWWSWCMGEIVP